MNSLGDSLNLLVHPPVLSGKEEQPQGQGYMEVLKDINNLEIVFSSTDS
jgi:hypothetical protein